MSETVSSLRQKGYRVYVQHRRFYDLKMQIGPDMEVPLYNAEPMTRSQLKEVLDKTGAQIKVGFRARGGETVVEIYDGRDEVCLGRGVATCSENDGYSKKIGRAIALGRALENLKMNSSVSCNWSEILTEIGTENVTKFVNRQMTARQFEQTATVARKLVRQLGTEEVRKRARQALTRRNIAI